MKPNEMSNLEKQLNSIGSIGKKLSHKIAFDLVGDYKNFLPGLLESLEDCRKKIIKCNTCHILTNKKICDICLDTSRNNYLIVVSNSLDAWHIENQGIFNAHYHILNGEINPSKKIRHENLNFDTLKERSTNFKEIIIATNPTMFGEMTANHTINILKNENIKITKLASGIPVGAKIDYIDGLTLKQAFKNRVNK